MRQRGTARIGHGGADLGVRRLRAASAEKVRDGVTAAAAWRGEPISSSLDSLGANQDATRPCSQPAPQLHPTTTQRTDDD